MRWLPWSLALLIASTALLQPVAYGQSTDARTALSRALAIVERASQAPEATQPALAQDANRELEPLAEAPIASWLREPLQASPPDLARAHDRLVAATATLDPVAREAEPPSSARESLRQILDGPPFSDWSWLALVPVVLLPVALLVQHVAELVWNAMRWPFDRLVELVERLLEGLFSTAAVLVLALLATIGLILLYRRGLRSAIVSQAELVAAAGELPPSAADALASAQRSATQGHYREACHFVFLSTLLWIEEQGRARFTPAATNREYLAQIAAQPSVAAALEPVVNRFDRLWYGQDSVGGDDYRDLLAAASRLREVTA